MRVVSGLNSRSWKADDEMDLGALRRLLAERRRWIAIPTFAALVASAMFVNVVYPRYTAETRLVLENQQNYMPGADRTEIGTTQQLDAEAVGSQVQILTSRDLARKVIKSAGLQGNPEFDPLANGMGAVERLLVLSGLKRDPTRLSPEDRILESYFDRLTVLSPSKTRVLTVEFGSRDPDLSARVANTIADLYLDFQSDAKREHAKAAAESLGLLVMDLKSRVASADAKAEAFRSQAGLLVGSNNTSINAQQLGDVNTELAKARTAQADSQAKANLLRDMIKQGRISEIPDVSNNELVRRISEQRVTAKAQLALESRTLLPGHPRIKELSAQVTELDGEIRAAGEKTARSLDNEARVASARVENLARALDVQKKLIGASGSDEVQMRELDRAARALKDELDSTTTRYQEALARETSKAGSSDARVFSRALAPQIASFPKKLPIVAISTLAALILSIGVVAARGFWVVAPSVTSDREDPRLDDAEVAQPVGTVASVETVEGIHEPLAQQAVAQHILPSAHALDEVVTDIETLGLSMGGLVLVVSLDEGNDAGLALALAHRLVTRGRVMLVAGDGSTVTPEPHVPGLADIMAGAATFSDAIHRDENSRLHVIPAGRAELAASRADLGSVLDALKGTYDAVVFGAPASMGIEEAQAAMARTEIAIVGPGDESAAVDMIAFLRAAGVSHVLRVTGESMEAEARAA